MRSVCPIEAGFAPFGFQGEYARQARIGAWVDCGTFKSRYIARPMVETQTSFKSSQFRTVKVLIKGRVQGVWFRGWTVDTARGLGLDGWVQNRRDGSVQAVFSGPAGAVGEMLQLCAQGPPAADVSSVDFIPKNDPVPEGFQIKPSV